MEDRKKKSEATPSSFPALSDSSEYLTKIINSLAEPVLVTDENLIIIMANDKFCSWQSMNKEEVIGMKCIDFNLGAPEDVINIGDLQPTEKKVSAFSFDHPEKGQQDLIATRTLFTDSRDRRFIVTAIRDVTEEKQAIRRIEEISEKIRQIVQVIDEGIMLFDGELRFRLWNRYMAELTGWKEEEVLGKKVNEVFPFLNDVGVMERLQSALKGKEVGRIDFPFNAPKSGKSGWASDKNYTLYDNNKNIIGVIGTVTDTTTQTRLQEEQQRVDRLESLGVLAGGIAHDFNNLLTGIMGFSSLALKEKNPVAQQEDIQNIIEATKRATNLVKQLMAFAKGGKTSTELQDSTKVIEDSARFALGKSSQSHCEFDFPDDLWPAKINAGQIAQLIQNLVINANQAMPDGGIVRIGAENLELETDNLYMLKPGLYIQITVTDSGVGIPEKNLSKIFDPYFTTKTNSQGTGLGLAVAHTVAKKHEGYLGVKSKPSEGSTFTIILPAEMKVEDKKKDEPEERENMKPLKILVMDDEAIIQNVLKKMLEQEGHKPIITSHGAEAIEQYKRAMDSQELFDLVILDLTIPGKMGGAETLTKLKALNSSVIAVVSTGYSTHPPNGFNDSMPKPYSHEQVKEVISRVMRKQG